MRAVLPLGARGVLSQTLRPLKKVQMSLDFARDREPVERQDGAPIFRWVPGAGCPPWVGPISRLLGPQEGALPLEAQEHPFGRDVLDQVVSVHLLALDVPLTVDNDHAIRLRGGVDEDVQGHLRYRGAQRRHTWRWRGGRG